MKEVMRRNGADVLYVSAIWKWFVVWDSTKMRLTSPGSHISNVISQVRFSFRKKCFAFVLCDRPGGVVLKRSVVGD